MKQNYVLDLKTIHGWAIITLKKTPVRQIMENSLYFLMMLFLKQHLKIA